MASVIGVALRIWSECCINPDDSIDVVILG